MAGPAPEPPATAREGSSKEAAQQTPRQQQGPERGSSLPARGSIFSRALAATLGQGSPGRAAPGSAQLSSRPLSARAPTDRRAALGPPLRHGGHPVLPKSDPATAVNEGPRRAAAAKLPSRAQKTLLVQRAQPVRSARPAASQAWVPVAEPEVQPAVKLPGRGVAQPQPPIVFGDFEAPVGAPSHLLQPAHCASAAKLMCAICSRRSARAAQRAQRGQQPAVQPDNARRLLAAACSR